MKKITTLVLGVAATLTLASCDLSSLMGGGLSIPGIDNAESSRRHAGSDEYSFSDKYAESSWLEQHEGYSGIELTPEEEDRLLRLYNEFVKNGGSLSFASWLIDIQYPYQYDINDVRIDDEGNIIVTYGDGREEVISSHNWQFDRTLSEGEYLYKCTMCGLYKILGEAPEECLHEYYLEYEVPTTCQYEGEKVYVCSLCGEQKITTIPRSNHDIIPNGEVVTAPTCTETGLRYGTCSYCGSRELVEMAMTGHTYLVDPETTQEDLCSSGGTYEKYCIFCGVRIQVSVTAGEHVFNTAEVAESQLDPTRKVVEGVAYRGYTSVGYEKEMCVVDETNRIKWDAKQVTTNCKAPSMVHVADADYDNPEETVYVDKYEPHIVETDEGVQFWGRAIGNAQYLDETGTTTIDHVFIPDESIEGSYMEYKINLSEPLSNVKLSSYLKTANYLSSNDVWRHDPTPADDDWTPGYLKGEDGEMHLNDWRYVFYIDGQQLALDDTVSTPKGHNTNINAPAKWYTVPMEPVDLAAGEHTVRIVMSGGYRHTFINWALNGAAPHEHSITTGEKSSTSALRNISCPCENLFGYELRANDATSGQLNPSETGYDSEAKNTRLGKGGIFEDVWDIAGIAAGTYNIYLEARCSASNATQGYWNSAASLAAGNSISNNGGTEELANDYKYKIAVTEEGEEQNWIGLGNDVDNYAATGINQDTPNWTNKPLATLTIGSGKTQLSIKNMNNGYSIWVYGVRLIKVA